MTQKKFDNSKAVSTIVMIGLILCLVIIVVVIGLNIAKTQVPYTESECKDVQVPYSERECKDVQVPYTASECKNVQTPYSAQDCLTKTFVYNVVTTTCTQYVRGIFTPDPAKVVCTLNNLEQKPGPFVMTYGFLIAGQPVVTTASLNMYAMGTSTQTYTYNGQVDNCICRATAPTYQDCSQVTKYRTESQCSDVTKYRTDNQCQNVTKYRTESQCQNVTKYKTISVWQSLLG